MSQRPPGEPVTRVALSPAEAAEALGISRAKLYGLLDSGALSSVKLDRRRLIRPAALDALLDGLDDPKGAA